MGVTLASFHSSGKTPWLIEAWKNKASTGASSFDSSFNTLDGIPSGPAALWMLRPSSNFLTPSDDTVKEPMEGNGLGPLFLMVALSSSLLKTEENCSFSIFAFVKLSEYVTPFLAFSGETPELSHFLLLMKPQNRFGLVVDSGLMMLLRYSLYACLQADLVAFFKCW